jgi:U6 snRNA-associated Sm-like protein LSm7
MDAMVLVKCLGGRELKGILRGFDDLVNLVIDESEEFVRGMLPDHQRLQYLYP